MSHLGGEPNPRGYLKDYCKKYHNSIKFKEEAEKMLQSYNKAKEGKVPRLESYITKGEIEKNHYVNLTGFRCCKETICRPHGDVIDMTGRAFYIDEELALNHNLRYRYPDFLSVEVKNVLKDKNKSFSRDQILYFSNIHAIISLAGYHSYEYEDTGCPVIHPRILSPEEYEKELEWNHGLGNPVHHDIITSYLTSVYNNNPEFYGGDQGHKARIAKYKEAHIGFNPRSLRSNERILIEIVSEPNPHNRMPAPNETLKGFYDRIASQVKYKMFIKSSIPSVDLPNPTLNHLFHLENKTKVKFDNSNNGGSLFEKVDDNGVSYSDNHVLKIYDNKRVVFSDEIVMRVKNLKKEVWLPDSIPSLRPLIGGTPFPKTIPSKNLSDEARHWVKSFKVDTSYNRPQKETDRYEARVRMGKISKNKKKKKGDIVNRENIFANPV